MSILLEACVGCYEEAKKAEIQGADRVELCDNLAEGGTTPSYGTIYLAKKNLNIPIAVIIRPRGGDFVYSNDEFEIMKRDIVVCKELGVETVVFGILNKDNKIDIERTNELIELSSGLKVTFHMAFDEIDDKFEALNQLIDMKVDRVLTKGCNTHATDGKNVLKRLIEKSNDMITILVGGGVNYKNYKELSNYIGCKEMHGSKIVGDLK
ncbi:copper homeostasis protein CutC [Clostridium sp. 1001271B_151109_B4]|uniref:copper homeostasis protein CutC n=1 Tax=Clostridium sp. 1001271B_151109_B4 TaxID=2787148 RepID=UPI0018ABFFA1|nr:copper homeostasis protein CutC [Clostridium sp. 1001271B_151109_B4]